MFASGTGSMRGPRVKTPLLFLLLLTALTRTVLCQDEETTEPEEAVIAETAEPEEQVEPAEPGPDGDTETSEIPLTSADAFSELPPDPSATEEPLESPVEDDTGSGLRSLYLPVDEPTESTVGPDFTGSTFTPKLEEGLSLIIILIPVVLVVLIIGMIVCGIFINRKWNKKVRDQELRKEDPYLDGSSTEKVPMPMFEEDVPSVLELEMEELGQWMKKDGETLQDSTLA
ncbi:transmembrane protein 154 isoform X1 [Plectropomus leopardus]|uniref:transmembrane protein 154 isoform X1 n=1 Tax=Plectropomus leopardus TaxID=160734 RepID=UPI001C4D984A|nr:transmembrane protein 154 isoform X1 [Plectropomus leopardus]